MNRERGVQMKTSTHDGDESTIPSLSAMFRTGPFFAFLLVVLLLVGPPVGGQIPDSTSRVRSDRHVIMISVDGLMPDTYTSTARLKLKTPNLVQFKLGGSYAEGVEGVYPSVTYPAHTSLITGVRPAVHGIVQNRIFEAPTDPQTREWYFFSKALKTDTLWSLAKKAGLVTAAVGWPVTVGAEIDYNVPEIFDPMENPPTPKRTIEHTTPGLIARALAAGVGKETTSDGRRVAFSEYIITNHKPNLMLIHLVELDSAQHRNGPHSPAALAAVEEQDTNLGRIVEATRKAGIFDKTTFLVVSDHGFAEVTRRFEPGVLLVKEKLITLGDDGKATDWKAAPWPAGGSCAIVLRNPDDKETATAVTNLFRKVASRNGGPLDRVLTQDQLKKLGAIPEATLMLEAATGFAFGDRLTGPEITEPKDYRGTHGHLPSRPQLRSSLLIYGEAARVGASVPLARMIDIAPTASALLGLRFNEIEGRPIRELVREGLIPPTPEKQKADKK
jgi:predicted AlkP superfamily pyrophosphatase or phosphodiesterase